MYRKINPLTKLPPYLIFGLPTYRSFYSLEKPSDISLLGRIIYYTIGIIAILIPGILFTGKLNKMIHKFYLRYMIGKSD